MFKSKRVISSIISGIFAVQILTSTVLSPFGLGKVEAANLTTVTESVYNNQNLTELEDGIISNDILKSGVGDINNQPIRFLADAESEGVLHGDVNGDGEVNSIDFAFMRLALLGVKKEDELINPDVNGDGNFNAIDFAYMRKYLLGDIKEFPINAITTPTPTKTPIPTVTDEVTPTPTLTITPTPTVSSTPTPPTPIPTQTGNSVFRVIKNEETSITISWDPVTSAKGYEICADGIITKSVTGTSYEHTGLIKNTWHSYKVRAKFENSESEWSEVLRICTAPQKPIEVNGDVTSGSTAIITWEQVAGAASYQILRNDETTPIVVEQPLCEVTGIVSGKDYIYEVKALDSNGIEMGNSGRLLVNTGESNIYTSTVLYENRIYGGNLTVNNNIVLNTYKVVIKSHLSQSGGNLNVDGGYMDINGNYGIGSNYGTLTMKDDNDYILVTGNFTTRSISEPLATELSAGTMEINGDFYQYRGSKPGNFRTSGNHKVVLSKNVSHKIFIESSNINILELEKSESGEVSYVEFTNNNYLSASVLRSNGCIIKSVSFYGKNKIDSGIIIDGNLENHGTLDLNGSTVNVNGNVLNEGTLDLNSGELFVNGNESIGIKGDFIHSNGTVFINGGYIEVRNNFEMGYDPFLGDRYVEFKMQNENDYIKIFGDFSTRTITEQDVSLLSAGTIEVKGDFYQYRGRDVRPHGWNGTITYYKPLNFRATGTHKVFLSGDKKQKIYFESPSYFINGTKQNVSTFNILCINKPLDYGYTFEYPNNKNMNNQPWKTIEENFANANPPAGTTITKPSLTPAREGLAMAEVNGRIYAFGGKTENEEYLNTVSEYDYIADEWTEDTSDPNKQMQKGKSDFAIAATDNDIYIFGGFDGENYLSTVERYNPADGKFILRDSIPPMPTARSGAKAVLIDDKIYVIGGRNETEYLNTIEIYDTKNNTWTTVNDNTNIRRTDFGMASYGEKIYIFGGCNDDGIIDTVEEYDTTTGKCTEKTPLPIKTKGLQACNVDGKIYLFCGTTFDETTTKVTNTVDRYDPQTHTYLSIEADKDPNDNIVKLRPLQYARTSFGAVAAFGRVFIAAGNDGTKCLSVAGEYVVNQIKGTTFGDDYNGTEGRGTRYDSTGANVLTGNYLTQSMDISIDSPAMNVEAVRSYNSSDADTKDSLMIGNGWRMSFETFVKKVDSNTYKVKASTLRLRKAPATIGDTKPTDWDVICGLANGTTLKHTGNVINWTGHSDWFEVITPNNQIGWVSSYYLTEAPGIEVTYPTGSKIVFTGVDTSYKAPVGCYDELTKTTVNGTSMYKLKKKDQTVYLYNYNTGKLAYQEDRYGNRIKFQYDTEGKLDKIYDCDSSDAEIGRTLNLKYSSEKLESISDGAGRIVSYNYTDGKLSSVTNLNNKVTKYEYYTEGEGAKNKIQTIKKINDEDKEITLYTNFYDELGRIIKQVDSNNKAAYYMYTDLSADDTSEMTTNGLEICRQYYNRKGDLTKEIYNINFPDRPIRVIDAIGRETTTQYYLLSDNDYVETTNFTDQMLRLETNRKLWETNLSQKIVTAEVVKGDNTTTQVNRTILEMDDKQNVTLVQNPDNTEKRYKYNKSNDLEYVIDEMNYQTYYHYEDARLKNVIKTLVPVDSNNLIDNITKVDVLDTNKNAITTYGYEDKKISSLVKKVTYPNGTYTENEYYDQGMLKSTSNGVNTTAYNYDNCFRVESVTTDLLNQTIYEYDNMNNVTKITKQDKDENSSITRMFYDYDGRMTQEINPLMYNSTDDKGSSYSGKVSGQYSYDPYGRVLNHTQNVKNTDGSIKDYSYIYTYDGEGNLETETKPSKAKYTYNYDGLGRLTAVYCNSISLEEYEYNEYIKMNDGTYGTEKVHTKYLSSYKDGNDTKHITSDTKYLIDYAGRTIKVTNPTEGDVEEFSKTEYYKDGKVRKVTDPRNNSTLYTYNNYDNANLGMVYDEKFVPVTGENGNIKYSYSKITYDLSGRKVFETAYVDLVEITEETDGKITIKAGSPQSKYNEIHYEYYSNNKVMRISSYGVDTTKIPAKSTMAKITEYKYDKDGNVTKEKTKFDSGKQTINVYLDYNMYGKPQKTAVLISNADLEMDLHDIEGENIVAYNDLFTDATRNESYGYSSDYEDYSSLVTSYSEFDKAGNVGVVTSPNGQTVNYYYDSLGRVGKQIIPDTEVVDIDGAGNQTSVETITTYNWEGKVADIKVYASNRLLKNEQYQYNSRGLLEKTIQKGITTKKFDRVTNTETVTTQDLTTAYEYDIAGRLVAEVTPENYVGYINGEGLLSKDTVNRTEYLYDKQGRLISKAYRGKIKEYNESNGDFTEDTRYIVIEAYKYDANGNVLKKVDGEAYNKVYDSAVAVKDLIDSAYGVEYSYNLANQLETIKNPEFTGATGRNYNQKYAYDGLGRKVNEVTAHGVNKTLNIKDQAAPKQVSSLYYSNTRYLYDDVNRKLDVWVKDNVDNPTSKEYTLMTEYYDYAGSNKNSVDANGKLTSYEYNSFGAQRNVIYSGDVSIPENIVKNKYDTVGNLKYQIDSVGNVKEYDYDLFGRVISEKTYGTKGDNSCETENRYLYDLYGNVKYQIDANNTVTKNEYDELGRLTRSVIDNVTVVDPATGLDSTTRTSTHETLKYYDKNGNVINEVSKVTENDTLNNTTRSSYSVNTYEYDRMGRLIRKTDPTGNAVEKINYNYNSAQIESYDGEDHLKTFEYNKDGKVSVTKQRLEAGEYRKTEQFYDANGNVSTVIDGKGNQTVYTYNEQNKLTEVSSYEKVGEGLYKTTDTTRYTYYNNGNMKSQEINGIITNTLHYNARNLVKEKEYLGTSNNIVSYNYYADGTVSDVTDRENIKTQYLYNPQGLVLEENAVDGKDQSFTKKSFEYDNAGNQLKSTITSSTTAPEVIERTYDELGRVKTKAVSNIEGKVIYVYDIVTSEGLTAETAIDQKNNTTTKVYDTTGRLAFVKKGDIEAENAAQYIYYGNGAAQSVIYAGGAREDYEYYEDGLLKSLINTKNDGSELESFVYTYDENGNMLSKLDNKGITEYTYDNLNRLKTVDEHYSGKNTEYAYDKLGNRTTEIIKESGIIKEHIYSYNYDLNQLDKVTVKIGGTVNSTTDYGYDANGNQISSVTDGKTITYAYDEFNQLISTNGAGYGYNAEGYRISKKVDGSLTKYLYEFDKVVLEVESKTGQADKVNRNIYGTNLLMRTADGQSYYYMYNGHADVTALINVATGNVDATYYYDAFGNIDPTGTTGDVNNNITYAGYQYDEETGLYYLNARMYDPKVARFLQEDTYAGNASDPLSLNLYTYCVNNPLIYVDPTGHSPKEAVFYKNLESQLPISEIAKKVKGASYSISKGSGTTIVSYNKKTLTFDSSTITNMEDFYWAFGDVDSVGDKSPIIEAYDLLNMYSTTASCYSRLQIDSMYRNLFLDIQVEMMENQYKQQLDALQELMLENKAIQSNDEMFYSIGSYYENYSLFSNFYADKLTKVLRSDKRFSKVISDEISRRDIEFAKEASSFMLDSIDIVGDVKGGAEALFGYNFIKQERLSNTERYITAGTTAAPYVFGAIAKRARPILKSIGSADGITAKLTNKLLKRANTNVGGNTGGLFRKSSNIGVFKDLQIPMQMKEVKKVLKASDINYKGVKIRIIRDPELIGKQLFGYTHPSGKMVDLYPDAFSDMENLVKTLGHERIHIYQNKTLGVALDSDTAIAYEKAAHGIEDTFWNYFLGKGDR